MASFLEKLDQRQKFMTAVAISAVALSVAFCVIVLIVAFNFAQNERRQIYVLNGGVPYTAQQTDKSINLDVEAKAHVTRFHELFFNLPPDDKYIQQSIEKAMYMVDESGLAQYNTLKERGFYNNIIAASATFHIMTDSIHFNAETMKFTYFGRQRIERKTSILYRELITEGDIIEVQRTENNPHGLIITNYRTVQNKDIDYRSKNRF